MLLKPSGNGVVLQLISCGPGEYYTGKFYLNISFDALEVSQLSAFASGLLN